MTLFRMKIAGTSLKVNSLIDMTKTGVFFLLLSLYLSGCAVYTFNPKGKSTISTIGIERFTNTTNEYGLEDRMTDQIIDAFIADGSMKVVPTENAEAILRGKLIGYSRQPYNPDENDQVESYKVNMNFEIKLINPIDETEIWTERVPKSGIYNLDSQTEEDGQLEAIVLLIEHIINKTTKSW